MSEVLGYVERVLPPGSNPGPEVQPTGLIFTGVAGAQNPGSERVTVANVAGTPLTYGSNVAYVTQGDWIIYQPANAALAVKAPAQIVVQPDFTGQAPGILRGVLTLAFSDGTVRTVGVLSVVAPAGAGNLAGKDEARFADGCQPRNLYPIFTQLGTGLSVAAGWPVAVQALVVDDCGSPLTNGSVVATFSNGDPALSLTNLQGGLWTGTWQPRGSGSPVVTVTVTAQQSTPELSATARSTIGLQGNQPLPVVSNLPLSAVAFAQGPLAPGDLVLIQGSGLADGQGSSTSTPLAKELAGASVLIGARSASLLYTDESHVIGLVPFDLPVNTQHQVLVQRGNRLAIPSSVTVAAARPAIFSKDGTGQGQGLIYQSNGGVGTVLADTSNPVRTGDTIVIYCAGLGALDQEGAVLNPVSVSIGEQPAQVTSARAAVQENLPPDGPPAILRGLTTFSSFVGLYQITVTAPDGVADGDAVVTISVAEQSSQPGVTLSVSHAP